MKHYQDLNTQQVKSEWDSFTEDRHTQFYKFFPRNTHSVLDIGCNTGRGGRVLKDLDDTLMISGLDVVEDRLDRLPKEVYQNRIYGSSTSIPSDDYTFDVVIAGELIEHLYSLDVTKTLAEVFRVIASFLLQ